MLLMYVIANHKTSAYLSGATHLCSPLGLGQAPGLACLDSKHNTRLNLRKAKPYSLFVQFINYEEKIPCAYTDACPPSTAVLLAHKGHPHTEFIYAVLSRSTFLLLHRARPVILANF